MSPRYQGSTWSFFTSCQQQVQRHAAVAQELAIGDILRSEIDFPQLSAAFGLVSKGFWCKNHVNFVP